MTEVIDIAGLVITAFAAELGVVLISLAASFLIGVIYDLSRSYLSSRFTVPTV